MNYKETENKVNDKLCLPESWKKVPRRPTACMSSAKPQEDNIVQAVAEKSAPAKAALGRIRQTSWETVDFSENRGLTKRAKACGKGCKKKRGSVLRQQHKTESILSLTVKPGKNEIKKRLEQ